eukprot:GILI01029347.1.p2 GENE.GILI01029347.1~~GILI01029347.1.p2  ORF type:complete len:250 (+),score=49.04 GILI01029347.1:1248-1997(+)
MNEALLHRVIRFMAADMSPELNRSPFERALLSRVTINPRHVTSMNDVLVVPIESNFLQDIKTTSKMVCRAVGNASSKYELSPGVFDFACAYPPPKMLSGSNAEHPVPMTIAARVSRRKKNSLVVQFVTRDALHGKEICSGQQLFNFLREPLYVPKDTLPLLEDQSPGHVATTSATESEDEDHQLRSGGDDEIENEESLVELSLDRAAEEPVRRKAPTRAAAFATKKLAEDSELPDDPSIVVIDDDDEAF